MHSTRKPPPTPADRRLTVRLQAPDPRHPGPNNGAKAHTEPHLAALTDPWREGYGCPVWIPATSPRAYLSGSFAPNLPTVPAAPRLGDWHHGEAWWSPFYVGRTGPAGRRAAVGTRRCHHRDPRDAPTARCPPGAGTGTPPHRRTKHAGTGGHDPAGERRHGVGVPARAGPAALPARRLPVDERSCKSRAAGTHGGHRQADRRPRAAPTVGELAERDTGRPGGRVTGICRQNACGHASRHAEREHGDRALRRLTQEW